MDQHRQRGPARDRTLLQPGRCVASAAAIPRNRPARLAYPACIHCRQANLGASLSASTRITAHLGKHAETCASCVRRFGRQATFAGLSLILGTLNCVCSDDSYGSNPGFLRFYAFGIGERRDAEMDRRDELRENSAHPFEMAAAHACRGRAQALVRARSTRLPPLCPPRSLRSRGPIRSPRAHSSSRRWAQARRPWNSNTVDAHLCCSPCVHSQQRLAARGWA